jgi:putative restriction endonuclease
MSVINAFNDSAVVLRKNMTRLFGEIEGIAPGAWFKDRDALSKARVHGPTVAGISGGAKEGADSIVLSGGYADDEDFGDVIIYTGAGGLK